MKKSDFAIIAVLISVLSALCVCAFLLKDKLQGDGLFRTSGDSLSIGGEDYIDDLDVPEIPDEPDRDDKAPSKVRRGYIPIRLNREETAH